LIIFWGDRVINRGIDLGGDAGLFWTHLPL